MIWVSDHTGSVAYVCSEWSLVTGQSPDESLGWGWADVLHPDDRTLVVEGFREACRRRVEFMLRFRLRHVGGGYGWVLSAATPSFTPLTHDFLGFLGHLSQYDDEAPGRSAKAEIGTFTPGQAMAAFAPVSKLDIAADHLIMAKAVSLGHDDAITAAIDRAIQTLAQALVRDDRLARPVGGIH